jgi:hypothetical protein
MHQGCAFYGNFHDMGMMTGQSMHAARIGSRQAWPDAGGKSVIHPSVGEKKAPRKAL